MSCCSSSNNNQDANVLVINATKLTKKIVFLGDCGVGKTCCIERKIRGRYGDSKATIFMAYDDLNLEYNNQIIKCQLWDTAGQERYNAIAAQQVRDADIGIVAFSLNDNTSLANVVKWIKIFYTNNNDRTPIIVAAMKSDLYTDEELKIKLTEFACHYPMYNIISCSSVTGSGIDDLFNEMAKVLSRNW